MSNYHNKTKIISIISFGIFFGLYNLSVGFNLNDEISSMIKKFNNGDISKRYQDTFYSAKLPEDPYGEAIKSIEQQSMQEKIAGTEHIEKALAEKNCSLSQKKIWAILYYYVPEFKSDLARSLKKELGDTSSKNFIMDHDKVMDYCYDYYNCLILSEESRSERTKISYYTPRDVETNCKEFFQENYRRGQGNEERQQNIQTTQLGYDKYRNSTTEDSPYDIMSDIGNIGKLLYEEVEEPITPVSYRLPVFSNSANALQQRKKNNNKPVNSGEQKNNPGTTGDNDEKEDFTDEDEDETQQLTGKALEIEKARETLNVKPIEKSLEEYDITINVKADEGTFPEGTRLYIEAIKGNTLEEVKQQISEDFNNADEYSEIIAFDIKFLYKLSDGTEIEIQPKNGESVQVTFDYSKNTNFKTAYEYDAEGVEIFHINDKNENGEKVAKGSEVIEKIEINKEESEKINNAVVIDAESFSIYGGIVRNTSGYTTSGNIVIAPPISGDIIYDGIKMNTITITGYFGESITILDRNLGATKAGTGKDSYGYYFQWGNNHGFTEKDNITQANINDNRYNGNGPLNPLNGNLFCGVYGDIWENYKHYDFIWGGEKDNKSNNYNAGNIKLVNVNLEDITSRQGPCPEGFHIPSAGEWSKLLELWGYKNGIYDWESDEYNLKEIRNQKGIGEKLSNDLLIPFAGEISVGSMGNVSMSYVGKNGFLWTSSPFIIEDKKDSRKYLSRSMDLYHDGWVLSIDERSNAQNIRCFKDTTLIVSNPIKVYFNTDGGKLPISGGKNTLSFLPYSNQLSPSIKISNGNSRYISSLYDIEKYLIPTKTGYEFIGWYSDKNLTNKFDYDTILTQDITLYARWAKNISHNTIDGVKTLTIYDSFSDKSITIMESNLGSKSKKDGYQIPWTIGNLYQWGNNYGFTEKQIKTESHTPIKYKNYGPKNPYKSSKYTVLLNPAYNSPDYGKYDNTDYWENGAHYPNLRGGETDSKSNNRGLDNISSTATNRQGPCPEGFHIPSKGEWDELLDIWSKNNDVTRRKTQFYEGPRGRETWPDHNPSNKISKDLNLWPESEHECLWTSSPEEKIKGNSYTFKKGYYYTPTTTNISNSVACQIRCFLNPSTSKSDKLEINLGSNLKQLASDIKNFNGEPTPQPAEGPTEEPTIPQPSLEPQPINNNTEPKMQGLNNYIQNGLLGSTNKTYYGNSCEESNKESTEDYLEEFFNSDSSDSPNSSNEDFDLTDEEYEDLIEYMQGAIDDYLSLTDEQKKEISKNVGNHNNQINSTTPSELEDTANQIKNCFQSCNGLRFDQKASCMMMCACGEINSPIFDPSKTPGLGPILMIRFCTIPGVNHNFSVGGRKIMSIEEGIREIFGVVDKLSREGRLGIWTQQHNFLDSTTKKTKISDTVAFTISVEFADVGDYKPKQSTQYKEKKAEDRNKTLQAAYHISNNLEDPVQKNRYRLINDNSSTTNDFSSITNIGTNKEKNSKLSTSSYTPINQNANADASRYNDTSESLHRRIDQQGHLWNEISKYINELDKEAQMLYAKKRI